MDEFIKILTNEVTLIGLTALLILLVVLLVLRQSKIKKLHRAMKELENQYNSVKSVPLTFKLNKSIALAKVNQDLQETVELFKGSYDKTCDTLKVIATNLADFEDMISTGDISNAEKIYNDIKGALQEIETQVHKQNLDFDVILEEETRKRSEINECKERYREIKNIIQTKQSLYAHSYEQLQLKLSDLEKQFTSFEEWMVASEFDSAKTCLSQINTELENLETVIVSLQDLIEVAKGHVPHQIDEVSQTFSLAKNKGVYLNHLEVTKNLELISDSLKDDLASIRECNVSNVSSNLEELKKRLEQLMMQIEKEDQSYEGFVLEYPKSVEYLADIKDVVEYCFNLIEKMGERFEFEVTHDKLKEINTSVIKQEKTLKELEELVNNATTPYSQLLISLKELTQELTLTSNDLKDVKAIVDSTKNDEQRAINQIVKLKLILHKTQVSTRKHPTVKISERYNEDLVESMRLIETIENVLTQVPVNIPLLNNSVNDAIDYIYKLYNNVNNIIETSLMFEKAMVIGNMYRSTYNDVDAELTHAELSYRSGEYTVALKKVIGVIEKFYPTDYDTMLKGKVAND